MAAPLPPAPREHKAAFVLVHLGPTFPEFLNDCLAQLATFSDLPVYLAISRTHQDKLRAPAIVVPTEDLAPNDKRQRFEKETTLDRSFREGFWKFASERFYILDQVISQLHLRNVFHLENDNLIYWDPLESLPVFERHYHIGACFDNDTRCIPGFMFIKSPEAMGELTRLLLHCSGANDMLALAALRNAVPGLLGSLPLVPKPWIHPLRSLSGLTTREPARYASHFEDFQGLFDAAAFGQFLGGVDPGNQAGDTRGFINEACLFQANQFKITWRTDVRGRRVPELAHEGGRTRLFNMHIHCKRLADFR